MNKRQAKKKRKKQIDDGLNAAIICAKRVGEFLSKWVGDGMPFPKESEENNDRLERKRTKTDN